MKLTKELLSSMVDHTNLKAFADERAMQTLCEEAKKYGFAAVAVNGAQVKRCAGYLRGTRVHVAATVGFPLGQTTIACKVFETREAIENGAREIDYVLNVSELKNGNPDYIRQEMRDIVAACREGNALSKVIFENCYLTDEEKRMAAEIAREERPDFIKTSTGFGTGGATLEDVRLMKSVVGNAVKVKAAGGIRDLKTAIAMLDAGAERLGTSAGVKIAEEFDSAP